MTQALCLVFQMFHRYMLQMFHMDVVKIDRDIAFVAMIVHVFFEPLFPMFHLFFQTMLQVCLFTRILRVFYLDVAYVLQ
jgi:hypothetical protein